MRKAVLVAFLVTALAMTLAPVSVQSAEGSTFVGMYGIVNKWGELSVWGRIGAFAEVPDKWAEVGLYWTDGMVHILSLPANYTFYAARLNITEMARLDYEGNDFYVSGYWNVYKITIEYDKNGDIIRIDIELIVMMGFGQLKVMDLIPSGSYTVEIEGNNLIEGIVSYSRIWPPPPPPYELARSDLNLDGTIDIFDLVHVARRHGTKPGMGIISDFYEYDFNSDLNSDYVIDIDDLIMVAKGC